MLDSFNIEFKNFSASKRMQRLARVLIDKIERQAPSDACLQLIFERTKDAGRASLKVASQAGVFFADVTGKNPEDSVQDLEAKITEKLHDWKRNRNKPVAA